MASASSHVNPARGSRKTELLIAMLLALMLAWMGQVTFDSDLAYGFNQSFNNRNVSVDTRVNVTGSRPEIFNVTMQTPLTLAAGSQQVVTCNATVRDFNGFADIDTVSGVFYNRALSNLSFPDDNNTHYTNSSCAAIVGQQGGFFSNYTCSFALSYYAVNGTWNCTVIANDTINLRGNGSGLSNVSALFALNVTPLIDYGEMAMGDLSDNMTANVTNLGNWPINVSVRGYGRNFNDGLSFVCDQGNLSVNLQHFAANDTASYAEKRNLTATFQSVPGLRISKPVNDSGTLNTTYWQLYLDLAQNAYGLCNGTIVFQAENSG